MKKQCVQCGALTASPVEHSRRGRKILHGPVCQDCYKEWSRSLDDGRPFNPHVPLCNGHKLGHVGANRQYTGKGWYCRRDRKSGNYYPFIQLRGKQERVGGLQEDRVLAIRLAIAAAKSAGVYNETASIRWLNKEGVNLEEVFEEGVAHA